MNSSVEPASIGEPIRSVLSHTGICVKDLEASRTFYCRVFGFEETYGRKVGDDFAALMQRDSLDSYICILSLGERRLELIHHYLPPARVDDLRPTNVTGLTHLAIYVPDLVEAAQQVDRYGGEPLWDTHTRIDIDGDRREYMTVLDPDEVRIELIRGLPLG